MFYGSYQNVGKVFVYGVFLRIVIVVMNCLLVRNYILGNVMKVVLKEVIGLCFKVNFLIFRKMGKKDLEKFDIEDVCKEWCERVLVFYFFFFMFVVNKNMKNFMWFGSFVVVGFVLLKQRNCEMSVIVVIVGVFFKSKVVEVWL